MIKLTGRTRSYLKPVTIELTWCPKCGTELSWYLIGSQIVRDNHKTENTHCHDCGYYFFGIETEFTR